MMSSEEVTALWAAQSARLSEARDRVALLASENDRLRGELAAARAAAKAIALRALRYRRALEVSLRALDGWQVDIDEPAARGLGIAKLELTPLDSEVEPFRCDDTFPSFYVDRGAYTDPAHERAS